MIEISSPPRKLVHLVDEARDPASYPDLALFAANGQLPFYIKLPSGSTVFAEAAPNQAESNDVLLPARDLRRLAEARQSGHPALRAPRRLTDVHYLELTPEDAVRLLSAPEIKTTFFRGIVSLIQSKGSSLRHYARQIPWQSNCFLLDHATNPRGRPWFNNPPAKEVLIKRTEVLVDEGVLDELYLDQEDPFRLRSSSPAVYVLYLAARHFNEPDRGVIVSAETVETWVTDKAKIHECYPAFEKGYILKQVRKLINKKHNEKQGGPLVVKLNTKALASDEQAAQQHESWASPRLMLAIHAARDWQRRLDEVKGSWSSVSPMEQTNIIQHHRRVLESLGFTHGGEQDAVLRLTIYPVDQVAIRRALKSESKTHP